MADAEVTFAVPCDTVRQEINGKFIIVGMYTEMLLPFTLPQETEMSFFVWVRSSKAGDYKIEIDLYVEPAEIAVATLNVNFSASGPVANSGVGLPPVRIRINEPGAIVLKVRKEQKEILRLPISAPASQSASTPLAGQSPLAS